MTKYINYFHLKEVDHPKLQYILLHYFGNSQQMVKFSYRYYKNNGSFLDLTTNKKGNIINIELSELITKNDLIKLERLIVENLIENQQSAVGQIVLYSHRRVIGSFNYINKFQILPVPNSAPKIKFMSGEHPFLFQFKYDAYKDSFLDSSSRAKQAAIYVRVLNLLTNIGIRLPARYTNFAWVINIDSKQSEWRQLGYSYKNLDGKIKNYSDISEYAEIEKITFQNYYAHPLSKRGLVRNDYLTFPNNIRKNLDRAFSLDDEDWDKFYLACSWFYDYEDISLISHSSAYIALVTAIESLIDKSEKNRICKECGQTFYNVNKKFKNFMEKYISFLDLYPDEIKIMYDVRSGLAHGKRMFYRDLETSMLFGSVDDEETYLQNNVEYLTRIAIYNWLQSKT